MRGEEPDPVMIGGEAVMRKPVQTRYACKRSAVWCLCARATCVRSVSNAGQRCRCAAAVRACCRCARGAARDAAEARLRVCVRSLPFAHALLMSISRTRNDQTQHVHAIIIHEALRARRARFAVQCARCAVYVRSTQCVRQRKSGVNMREVRCGKN